MVYLTLTVQGITLGAIYALVALGFNLVYRTVSVIDFAQGDKVVVGGLVALGLVHAGLPLPLTFIVVIAGGAAAGLVYEVAIIRPALRRGTDVAIVATVGALLILSSGHILIWGATPQPFPSLIGGTVKIGTAHIAIQDFLVWAVVAVVVVAIGLFFTRTRYGKAMEASAADPMAAGTVGIDIRQTRMVATAVAFALAALAGVLIAPITLAGGTVGPALTLTAFTAAILGGLNSTYGVVVGSIIVGVFSTVAGAQVPFAYQGPMVYGLLIAVLLVRPSGLFGTVERLA